MMNDEPGMMNDEQKTHHSSLIVHRSLLDTFPIVRRKDEEKYGEYRTKRMVLEAYDKLQGFVARD